VDEIVVLGGGGHAAVVLSVLRKLDWRILGYTDSRDRGPILGVPYLGADGQLAAVIGTHPRCSAVIGVGKIDASPLRGDLQARLGALGFAAPVLVSPDAVVNEAVTLGSGTVVFDGTVVNTGTRCGGLCILNTNCAVEHDCRLGDNVHIAPGATVCGGVTIGDDCMIGAGATVVQEVTVGAGCLVGAGATVVGDLVASGTYAGTPARRVG
jgi:UDP-perosamine 4-acetyltransferase